MFLAEFARERKMFLAYFARERKMLGVIERARDYKKPAPGMMRERVGRIENLLLIVDYRASRYLSSPPA